ncbi:hypothetical protein M422DRAFT_65250 [Sphaerobolus stellatus SS14]|nr:hypothetical protein M422DRAFT_65250 [Sphaerobolus stellatus SS14]
MSARPAGTDRDNVDNYFSLSPSPTPQTRSLNLPLRIIYTLNGSPQSLLARQKKKVVVHLTDYADNAWLGGQKFARVLLKTCLAVICSSSPELLADDSRDHSVYVVDPLESAHSTNNGSLNSPAEAMARGVSIGVGLLSWCLSEAGDIPPQHVPTDEDDDGYIVGRIVKDRGIDALEIIMSFRETCYQTQTEHAQSISSLVSPQSLITPDSSQSSATPTPSSRPSSPEICTKVDSDITSFRSDDSGQIPSSRFRIGRPPGAATHPEKRARRQAILAHKEKLEKLRNIAKYQRNHPFDSVMVTESDKTLPYITDEELAQQEKMLEDLEKQPLIVDQPPVGGLLTRKPLLRKSSISNSFSSKTSKKQRSTSPANAVASSSNAQISSASGQAAATPAPTNYVDNNDLLNILVTMLSKVDASKFSPPKEEKGKGKSKGKSKGKNKEQPGDTDLATVIGELVLLLQSVQQPTGITQAAGVTIQTPIPNLQNAPISNLQPWQYTQMLQPTAEPPRLFATTEETFYSQPRTAAWPYDQHWARRMNVSGSQDMAHDTHTVPGGGSARERSIASRNITASNPSTSKHSLEKDQNNAPREIIDLTQLDKENMPPPPSSRGLKRSSSILEETENASDKPAIKLKGKKRKQETSESSNVDASGGSNSRRIMGSVEDNRAAIGVAISSVTVPIFTASSPVRKMTSTTTARHLGTTAMSEPDYSARSMPIIATTSFPDPIMQPPKTPPRREEPAEEDVGGSLFTPGPQSTPRAKRSMALNSSSLFTPSPKRASHGVHVLQDISTITGPPLSEASLDIQPVKTGWDLPPSSPPPPTSPVSPQADLGCDEDEIMTSESTTQNQNGLQTITIAETSADNTSTADALSITLGSSAPTSDFDGLLSDTDFNFSGLDGEVGTIPVQEGVELDIEELWKSLGPVIAQAQNDSSDTVGALPGSDRSDFHLFGFSDGEGVHAAADPQDSSIDAIKLAEDLKALFGGCVL